MTKQTLFRSEALAARKTGWAGEVILIRPLSVTLLTCAAVLCASLLLAFLAFGSYTRRTTVAGQLVPDTGLVKVFSPQQGIVFKKLVREGQRIKKGDVLYLLSSERRDRDNGSVEGRIRDQVETRRLSLTEQRDKTFVLQKEERSALLKKTAAMQSEMEKLDSLIEGQMLRVKLANDTVTRYDGLLAQKFISNETAQQKQEDLLDQKNRLRTLERDRITLGRELSAVQSELETLALRQQNQLALLEREIASMRQELVENGARESVAVVAPEAGIATAVVAEPGQTVDSTRALVSLVPAGSVMQAHLYVPSRSIGFVRSGDAVLLRYQAFPYQKFGHAKATVVSVSLTALSAGELNTIGYAHPNAGNEALYLVTVKLDAQEVVAYGKPQPLQAGMLLEADVLQDTRKTYEWVLEPLLSLSGKL